MLNGRENVAILSGVPAIGQRGDAKLMLKQIRVGSCSVKNNFFIRLTINHNPITFYVAICKPLIIARKIMLSTAFRQWVAPDKFNHNIINFICVFMAFFHSFEVFLKLIGKTPVAQFLIFQVFPALFKRIIPFCGFFTKKDSIAFCYCGSDSGIKRWIFRANRGFIGNPYVKNGFRPSNGHGRLVCLKYSRFGREIQAIFRPAYRSIGSEL